MAKPVPDSIPTIVRSFKSASARRINQLRGAQVSLFLQRNYYEHVIRDDDDLDRIRQYIQENPALWCIDGENPDSTRDNGEGMQPSLERALRHRGLLKA